MKIKKCRIQRRRIRRLWMLCFLALLLCASHSLSFRIADGILYGSSFVRRPSANSFQTTVSQIMVVQTSQQKRIVSASALSFRREGPILFMGKGDGKKKRKKKSSSASLASSSTEPSIPVPPPQRVSNQINIPVRQQIRYAEMHKRARQAAGTSFRQKKVVRTKYRRSWDEEELEEKAEERRRRGQDPDWDVILSRNASKPLVIVDGYNVIFQWARLKKHMRKGDTARARQLLLDDLENLSVLKGWRIECVFDGTKRSTVGPLGQGPGSANKPSKLDQAAKTDVSKHGVRVVYTGVGVEADSYIESRCADAKNVTAGATTDRFIVVTNDAMIRLAGQNAGALCMSADRLVDELKACKQAIEYGVEVAVAKANGHSIRPKELRTYSPLFGRRSVLIEDKRNRTKIKETALMTEEELNLQDIELEEDENGVPWWAVVPNQTRR